MEIKTAQQKVHQWISQFEEGYFSPLLTLARFVEEMGEMSRVLSHQHGKTPKKGEKKGCLEEELGDIFFLVLTMANSQGIDLEEALEKTLEKYERRDENRWTRKEKV